MDNLAKKIHDYCDEAVTRQAIVAFSPSGKMVSNLPPKLPTMQECKEQIGYKSNYLNELEKKNEDISVAIKRLKDIQQHFLIIHGLDGSYNSTFAIFAAKNLLKWKDNHQESGEAGPENLPFNLVIQNTNRQENQDYDQMDAEEEPNDRFS